MKTRAFLKGIAALILLVAMAFGLLELLRAAFHFFFKGVNSNVAAAIVAGAASLLALSGQRWFEVRGQRIAALHERKSLLYGPLLEKWFELFRSMKDQPAGEVPEEVAVKFEEIWAKNAELICWASDEVLSAFARLRTTAPDPNQSDADNALRFAANVGNVFLAIRKDLGQKVKSLRPEDVLSTLFNEIPEMLGENRRLTIEDGVIKISEVG